MRSICNKIIAATLISILLLLATSCHKSSNTSSSNASTGEPRKDPSSTTGFYIPLDLDDALVEVDRIMGDQGREHVLKADDKDMIDYHFTLGAWMRNNWGLWGGSRLSQYFNKIGIHHLDDMAGIILDSYWRKLHGKSIDLDGQVRYYQEYWEQEKSQQKD
jgi:hypothetical protein